MMDIDDVLRNNLRETIENIIFLKKSILNFLKDKSNLDLNRDQILAAIQNLKVNFIPIIDARILSQTKIHKMLTMVMDLNRRYDDIRNSASTILDIIRPTILKEILKPSITERSDFISLVDNCLDFNRKYLDETDKLETIEYEESDLEIVRNDLLKFFECGEHTIDINSLERKRQLSPEKRNSKGFEKDEVNGKEEPEIHTRKVEMANCSNNHKQLYSNEDITRLLKLKKIYPNLKQYRKYFLPQVQNISSNLNPGISPKKIIKESTTKISNKRFRKLAKEEIFHILLKKFATKPKRELKKAASISEERIDNYNTSIGGSQKKHIELIREFVIKIHNLT